MTEPEKSTGMIESTNRQLKILLVEDDVVDRMDVERLLKRSSIDAELTTAMTGNDAIDELAAGAFDCVLLDHGLPDMDGYDVLDRLGAREQLRVPVVLLTGQDDEEFGLEAMRRGAEDYLVKGKVDEWLLKRSIQYAIERHHLRTELATKKQELDELFAAIRRGDVDTLHGSMTTSGMLRIQDAKIVEENEWLMAELARSNQELEQFAYVASHDLQEPLRKITSFTQLLKKHSGDQFDSRAHEYMDFIIDGASRLQTLIRDLLVYSRVGTQGDQARPTDAGQALSYALDNLALVIEESNAKIEHDALPSVMADESQLVQLFQNLVGNGIKFRRPDVAPVITVDAKKTMGKSGLRQCAVWQFRVADNGIGIPDEQQDRVFVIFQRLHTRTEYPGTGIGLALCRRIVERLGGQIWVEPGDSPGTAFVFTLPAVEAADD